MFTLIRALVYATLFIGFGLVFLPSQLLRSTGIAAPDRIGMSQIAGMGLVVAGASLVLSCILVFVFVGKGTAAPFDPPRKLVISGPYRYVRNPIYIGAVASMCGAALYYHSLSLLLYAVALAAIFQAFVVIYEEPTLRDTFGAEYMNYCARVRRWLPRWGR